jgi:hypothetical protein
MDVFPPDPDEYLGAYAEEVMHRNEVPQDDGWPYVKRQLVRATASAVAHGALDWPTIIATAEQAWHRRARV